MEGGFADIQIINDWFGLADRLNIYEVKLMYV